MQDSGHNHARNQFDTDSPDGGRDGLHIIHLLHDKEHPLREPSITLASKHCIVADFSFSRCQSGLVAVGLGRTVYAMLPSEQ